MLVHRRGHCSGPRRFCLAALAAVAPLAAGCLPLLVSSAKVHRPGEVSLTVAGLARSQRISTTLKRAGPVAAVIEGRGGLPGGIADAGFTAQVPYNALWDVKVQGCREGRRLPAVAVQAFLGIFQDEDPTFGGRLLATKTFGPLEATGMAGTGVTGERLWRDGARPLDAGSRKYVKNVLSFGGGAAYRLTRRIELVAGVVAWQASGERIVEETRPEAVREGPSVFATAGVRLRWERRREPPRPAGTLTALRGYVLAPLEEGRFEVGQPGLYRAVVLVDDSTKVLSDGEEVPVDELEAGRAVLIQGLALPRPSTFLARTIEFQN